MIEEKYIDTIVDALNSHYEAIESDMSLDDSIRDETMANIEEALILITSFRE